MDSLLRSLIFSIILAYDKKQIPYLHFVYEMNNFKSLFRLSLIIPNNQVSMSMALIRYFITFACNNSES